jgi:hypothetical protein
MSRGRSFGRGSLGWYRRHCHSSAGRSSGRSGGHRGRSGTGPLIPSSQPTKDSSRSNRSPVKSSPARRLRAASSPARIDWRRRPAGENRRASAAPGCRSQRPDSRRRRASHWTFRRTAGHSLPRVGPGPMVRPSRRGPASRHPPSRTCRSPNGSAAARRPSWAQQRLSRASRNSMEPSRSRTCRSPSPRHPRPRSARRAGRYPARPNGPAAVVSGILRRGFCEVLVIAAQAGMYRRNRADGC